MGIIYIENRRYASRCALHNPRDFKDIVDIKLTPENIRENGSLIPQVTLALANKPDLLLLVHIALADNGKYYFGYSIYIDDEYDSCGPHPDLGISKGNDTIYGCVSDAINHCKSYAKYYGTEPDPRIVAACKQASRDLNKLRLHQMTIFEFL